MLRETPSAFAVADTLPPCAASDRWIVDSVTSSSRLTCGTGLTVELARVQTNIVIFHLADGAPDAETVVSRARDRGVLLIAFGPRTLRAVTHLDVSREECDTGAETLVEIVDI